MDHATVDTTLNVYTQVLDGSLREAVQKVGGELFAIVHKRAASPLEGKGQGSNVKYPVPFCTEQPGESGHAALGSGSV